MEWITETWGYVAAAIGVITALWAFRKLVKEMKEEVNKPLNEIKNIIADKHKNDGAVINALQSMQRRSLLDSFRKSFSNGYLDMDERETLSKQYDSYIELGGNSFIKEMYKEVIELPIEKPKSKKRTTINE